MDTNKIEKGIEHLQKSLFAYKRVMTLPELASYIGMSEGYLHKLTAKNLIPHYQPLGKIIYFDRIEIDEWIFKSRVTDRKDIERKANSLILRRKRTE